MMWFAFDVRPPDDPRDTRHTSLILYLRNMTCRQSTTKLPLHTGYQYSASTSTHREWIETFVSSAIGHIRVAK
jgi:hypothetical protein